MMTDGCRSACLDRDRHECCRSDGFLHVLYLSSCSCALVLCYDEVDITTLGIKDKLKEEEEEEEGEEKARLHSIQSSVSVLI
ncbi:hypothetical protein E2C01_077626 [Portunus trituberculatus]|uniref:Uncharacterized protein n=1 Tax=Portunus trituberculatus TaxID=210409 RepID=A0A5B7IMK4_PORTR|nr:hypothetical protein [Portunus trituberculatus]